MMKIQDIIIRSVRNLLRSKLRTFLTVIAIVVGAFTLSLTTSLGEGVKKSIDDQTKLVGIEGMFVVTAKSQGSQNPAGNTPPKYNPDQNTSARGMVVLTDTDLSKIEKVNGIQKTYKIYMINPEYITTSGHDKYQISISPMGGIEGFDLSVTLGKQPAVGETGYIILTNKYLEPLGLGASSEAIGKTVTVVYKNVTGEELPKEYTVAAVVPNSFINGGASYISYDDGAIVSNFQTAGTQSQGKFAAALAKYDTNLSSVGVTKLQSELSDVGYVAQTLQDQIAMINGVISVIQIVLGFFGGIAILASVFGIVNTLLMGVYERIKEIGLMKALGMSKFQIFIMFSSEAISIGFLGGVIGSLLSWGVATVVNYIFRTRNFFGFENVDLLVINPIYIVSIIFGLMVISFIVGVLPSRRAANMDPITALRTE